jgi:Tfp pilus assembly protein PilF
MNPKEKEQSLKLAEHYFRSNNYSFAKHILEKIIQIEPNNSKANELLATRNISFQRANPYLNVPETSSV